MMDKGSWAAGQFTGLAKMSGRWGSWPDRGPAATGAALSGRPKPLPHYAECGGCAYLVPVSRVSVQLHLLLHPLQVGFQEALELLAVASFILEGAAVIHHCIHPVHVDELSGGQKVGQGRAVGLTPSLRTPLDTAVNKRADTPPDPLWATEYCPVSTRPQEAFHIFLPRGPVNEPGLAC